MTGSRLPQAGRVLGALAVATVASMAVLPRLQADSDMLAALPADAPDRAEKHVTIDATQVRQRLEPLARDEDLSRFIL